MVWTESNIWHVFLEVYNITVSWVIISSSRSLVPVWHLPVPHLFSMCLQSDWSQKLPMESSLWGVEINYKQWFIAAISINSKCCHSNNQTQSQFVRNTRCTCSATHKAAFSQTLSAELRDTFFSNSPTPLKFMFERRLVQAWNSTCGFLLAISFMTMRQLLWYLWSISVRTPALHREPTIALHVH